MENKKCSSKSILDKLTMECNEFQRLSGASDVSGVFNVDKYQETILKVTQIIHEIKTVTKAQRSDPIKSVHANFSNLTYNCPICYDDFNNADMVFAPCSHYFCQMCFQKWHKTFCPMCKDPMTRCIQYVRCGEVLKYKFVDVNIPVITTTAAEPADVTHNIIILPMNETIGYSNYDDTVMYTGGMDVVDLTTNNTEQMPPRPGTPYREFVRPPRRDYTRRTRNSNNRRSARNSLRIERLRAFVQNDYNVF